MEYFELAKTLSLQLVEELAPDEVGIVSDNFDAMAASGFSIQEDPNTRSFDLPQVWHYGIIICTFVGGAIAGGARAA